MTQPYRTLATLSVVSAGDTVKFKLETEGHPSTKMMIEYPSNDREFLTQIRDLIDAALNYE